MLGLKGLSTDIAITDLRSTMLERPSTSAVFGRHVKDARQEARMTQGELAERAGLEQQYVSLIERGSQNVTIDTASRLAAALERELWTLLGPDPSLNPEES
jgi:transcriptional regulator with XRE-family HTH domain